MNQSAHNVIIGQANKYSAMSDYRYSTNELVNVAFAGGAGEVSALSYIYTRAKCRIIDFLRKENRVDARFKTNFDIDILAKGNDFAMIDIKDEFDCLKKRGVFDALNKEELNILYYRYVDEMTFKEIGKRMGRSKAYAWLYHSEALRKIECFMRN